MLGAGSDGAVLALAMAHGLTAYDAAYLALAQERSLPLATLDQKLADRYAPGRCRVARATATFARLAGRRGGGYDIVLVRMTRRLSLAEATDLAARACRAAGAATKRRGRWRERPSPPMRTEKARAAFRISSTIWPPCGRDGSSATPNPLVTSPAPAAIHCDARGGIAQLGFDRAFDDLRRRAETLRPRAVRAKRQLHDGRTRLLSAPSGGGRPRRVRRDKRTGADDGRRGENARLLHQPDRFRRAAR